MFVIWVDLDCSFVKALCTEVVFLSVEGKQCIVADYMDVCRVNLECQLIICIGIVSVVKC